MNRQTQQPEKKEAKFYQTKAFLTLVAVTLAAILLGSGAIDMISSLFATEGVKGAQDEVVIHEVAPEPETVTETVTEITTEPAAEVTPEPELAAENQAEGETETLRENGIAEEAGEEAAEDVLYIETAANPLAEAIAANGMAYVRASGNEAYLQRWFRFQDAFHELMPVVPLFSSAYYDFYRNDLQSYYSNAYFSWATAIVYAYLGEAPDVQIGDMGVGEEIVIIE